MLETTLSMSFHPGTNVKGEVAGANWSFMLPSLDLEQIVCLGVPPSATLKTLTRLGQKVILFGTDSRQIQAIEAIRRKNGLKNLHAVEANGSATLPLPSGEADLVFIVGAKQVRKYCQEQALRGELQRLLKPSGLVYFEFRGALAGLFSRMLHTDIDNPPQLFWSTPPGGEMQTTVPLVDAETINYFLRKRLYAPWTRLPGLERAERFFSKHRPFSHFIRRYSALAGRPAAEIAAQPPRYLQSIAEREGMDIKHFRWGLSARGNYNARKVLFFLLNRASGKPEYIVKMTRDPALNPRIENEWRALNWLREKGIGDRETLPQVAFFGYHSQLAVLGETVIEGVPFRQRGKAEASDAYTHQALDWLTGLGAATADPQAATPAQVAQTLSKLFCQFTEFYRLAPEQAAFLADRIATLEHNQEAFPLVFQHGDPGTWNVLATPGGRIAFLDWEAAEIQGMPLWDLFYFLRSYCTWAARSAGTRDSLAGFAQTFLKESPLTPVVIDATRRYCERINLPAGFVEPLFYTCWVHRALKEVTRLTPARLDSGFYVSLLRLCIGQRNTPVLRRLFQD